MIPVLQAGKQLLRSEMICRRSQPEVVELGCESLALFGLRVNLLLTSNGGIGLFVPRSEYGISVHFAESEIGAQRCNYLALGPSHLEGQAGV